MPVGGLEYSVSAGDVELYGVIWRPARVTDPRREVDATHTERIP